MNIFVSHGIANFGGGASSAEYIPLRGKVVLISTKRLQQTGLLPSPFGRYRCCWHARGRGSQRTCSA